MGESRKCGGWFGWILVLIVLAAIVFAIWIAIHEKYQSSDKDMAAPVPGSPGAINQKYSNALKLALQFFDVQKCNLYFPNYAIYSILIVGFVNT